MSYRKVLVFVYPLLAFFYLVFSFAYTDPYLLFSYNRYFVRFQKAMWSLGLEHRMESSLIYLGLILAMYAVYFLLLKSFRKKRLGWRQMVRVGLTIMVLLILANPAGSHDIYNYIFNAKMVWFYKANPHVQVALNFPQDEWTRFMHNTHTPAPYGYGWTALSLIPSWLGFNRLKSTLLMFKLFVGAFFWWLIYLQKKLSKQFEVTDSQYLVAAFMLNPLVLIETFGNGHNDVVMMALALGAVFYGLRSKRGKRRYVNLVIVAGLLILSVEIKFATLLLIPAMVVYWLVKKIRKFFSFGAINAGALLTPLVTIRSQRFLPWYLMWAMVFMPLVKEGRLVRFLMVASMAGMLGYIPFFWMGEYNDVVLWWRSAISFGLPLSYLGLSLIYTKYIKKYV